MGGKRHGGQKAWGAKGMGGKRPGGKRPGGKRHGGQKVGGQKVGGQKTGGQKTGGQKTGGQKTGGQKSCHPNKSILSSEQNSHVCATSVMGFIMCLRRWNSKPISTIRSISLLILVPTLYRNDPTEHLYIEEKDLIIGPQWAKFLPTVS